MQYLKIEFLVDDNNEVKSLGNLNCNGIYLDTDKIASIPEIVNINCNGIIVSNNELPTLPELDYLVK